MHGRAPKPAKSDLQSLWFEALRRALPSGTCLGAAPQEMIYYGDLSNEFLGEECHDIQKRQALLESIEGADFETYHGELTYDIETPTDDILAYWEPTSTFARQLRSRIAQGLEPFLRPEGGPAILLAHSLGAVLTYDALCQATEPAEHLTLVTLGSPLTYPHFLRRSRGTPIPLAGWFNISARGDKICGPPTRFHQEVVEIEILNPVFKDGEPDPHHALGYLRHPRVGELVAEWMGAVSP